MRGPASPDTAQTAPPLPCWAPDPTTWCMGCRDLGMSPLGTLWHCWSLVSVGNSLHTSMEPQDNQSQLPGRPRDGCREGRWLRLRYPQHDYHENPSAAHLQKAGPPHQLPTVSPLGLAWPRLLTGQWPGVEERALGWVLGAWAPLSCLPSLGHL